MEAMSITIMRKAGGTCAGLHRALRSTPHVKARFGRLTVYKFDDGSAVAESGYVPCYGLWSEFRYDVNKEEWDKVLAFMS